MEVNTEVCRYCRRDIPDYSILTHEAHCERGRRLKNGQLLSPEPRSPSPVVEEPSECSVVSTPGDVEVTTLALDTPTWDDSKKSLPKTTPDSNITYIPIQLPNNGKFDSYLYNLNEGNGHQSTYSNLDRTLTNSPILSENDDKLSKCDYNIDNFEKPKYSKGDISNSSTSSPIIKPNYGIKSSWIYPEKAKTNEIWETIPESLLETGSNKSGSSVFDTGTPTTDPKTSKKDEFVNDYIWKNIPETVLNYKTDDGASNATEGYDHESKNGKDCDFLEPSTSNLESLKKFLRDINLDSINSEDATLKLGEDVISPEKSISRFNLGPLKSQSKESKDFDTDSLNSGNSGSHLNDDLSLRSGATTSTLKLGEDIKSPESSISLKFQERRRDFDKDSLNSGLSTPSTVFDLDLKSPLESNLDKNVVKTSPVFNKDLDSPEINKECDKYRSDNSKIYPEFNRDFSKETFSPVITRSDGKFYNQAGSSRDTTKESEKAPGVTCPDCHRIQKAGGLRQHLEEECQFRSKPCSFCGVPYRAKDLECHMVICGTRSEKCPDCEEMIMIKYKHIHLESNHGFIKLDDEPDNLSTWTSIPRLPLRPPDLINNIPLSTKDEDARVEIPCEFCEQIFPAYRLTVHQLGCRLKQQTNEKIAKNAKQQSNAAKKPSTTSAPSTPTTNKTTYDYPIHLSPPTPPSRKSKSNSTSPGIHIPTIVDAMPKYSPNNPSTSRTTPIVHHIPTVIQSAPKSSPTRIGVKPKTTQTRYTTSVHHIPTVVQTRPKIHHIPTVLEGTPRYHYVPSETSSSQNSTKLQNGWTNKEHFIPINQETGKQANTTKQKATKSNSAPLTPNLRDSPTIDVISFGNVLEVSDKFKEDWRNLERKIKDNSKDDLHVIPCEYCSKMLRIGEVMSHQMLCFLQH